MPLTDSDSRVMPHQEGGFAPNFTPTCLTDGHSGFILDAAVVNVVNEHPEALLAVDRATALCGESPVNFLADGGLATGAVAHGWSWSCPLAPAWRGEGEGEGSSLGNRPVIPREFASLTRSPRHADQSTRTAEYEAPLTLALSPPPFVS